MARRPRFVLAGLAALAVLAVTALGISAGLASADPAASPARTHRPNETIQKCLNTLAGIRAQDNALRKLRADVLAKRTYLYTIGHFQGHTLFVPVGVDEFGYFLTEQIFLGKIKPSQVAGLVRAIKRMTAESLDDLNSYIAGADSRVKKQQRHCDSLRGGSTTTPKPPPPSATTFTLQPSLTKVTNTHPTELTIDASARSAHLDHCCDGGGWKIDYSWKVPQTITPGKSYEITIGIKVLSVNPNQPLGDQMNALAPDFAQAIQAHWPDTPTASKTFTVPLAADQKDSSDIPITIGFVSSGVTYHYRK